jgi:ribosomal protein L11 methyltransferase
LGSSPALDLRYALGPTSNALQELLQAALDDFQPIAMQDHETADGWRVFFKSPAQRDGALSALRAQFGSRLTETTALEIPDEGWARRNQEQLKAVRVDRIIVAPPWDAPSADPRAPTPDIVVVIDPSTGFGTGHHESTRLCLRLLQQIDLTGRRVLDVGTGSGVLAIAACKLGARHVTAIDNDPDALTNARENVVGNGTSGAVEIREADIRTPTGEAADVVVANLTGAALQRHALTLLSAASAESILIVSGFSLTEAPDVRRAFGVCTGEQVSEGAWAALLLRKGNSNG